MTASNRVRNLMAALRHVVIHATMGMLLAALLGWLEVASLNQRSINEFNGIVFALAIYFTGPVACALAIPFQLACHARATTPFDRHLYSVAISLATYATVWAALKVPSGT